MKVLKRMIVLAAAVTLVVFLSDVEQVDAGKQFSSTYQFTDIADSTGNVPDTFGTTTAGGLKIFRIDWAKHFASITFAMKVQYNEPASDCQDILVDEDTIHYDVWTGDDNFDFVAKVWTGKYVPADSSWQSFTIPVDSSIASNVFFIFRGTNGDSSFGCAETANDSGITYDITVKAWGK